MKLLLFIFTLFMLCNVVYAEKLVSLVPGQFKINQKVTVDKRRIFSKNIKIVGIDSKKYFKFNGGPAILDIESKGMNIQQFSIAFGIIPEINDGMKSSCILRGPFTTGHGWRAGYAVFIRSKGGMAELECVVSYKTRRVYHNRCIIPWDRLSFISYVFSKDNFECYVDAKQAFSHKRPGDIKYSDRHYAMRFGAIDKRFLFKGKFADIFYFNNSLSASDVKELYQKIFPAIKETNNQNAKLKTSYPSDNLLLASRNNSNLVMNPSFENDLRYYTASSSYLQNKIIFVDSKVSFEGQKSMRIDINKPGMAIQPVTFAIPVTPLNTYNFSFYAKAKNSTRFNCIIDTGIWPVFSGNKTFTISPEWKRYNFSFKTKNAVVAPRFSFRTLKVGNSIWIDALQLEKGNVATTFKPEKLRINMTTDKESNLFFDKDKIECSFDVYSINPAKKMKLRIKVKDFNGKIVYREIIPLKFSKNSASLKTFFNNKLKLGVYSVSAELLDNNKILLQEFFRLARIKKIPRDNKIRSFLGARLPIPFPSRETALSRFSDVGMGWIKSSVKHGDSYYNPVIKNGIDIESSFSYGKLAYIKDGKDGFKKPNVKYPLFRSNLHKDAFCNLSEDRFQYTVDVCKRIVKKYPAVMNWQLVGEGLPSSGADYEFRMKRFMKLNKEVSKGIKSINPQIKLRSPSTTNLYPGFGMKQIETLLRYGGASIFDIFDAHTYRPCPDRPSLATDIKILLEMLKKYGFNGNVRFGEDMNYAPYNIPKLGLNPEKFADFWRNRKLSYDLGLGERIQLAYNLRQWLHGLRFYPKIEGLLWHNSANSAFGCEAELSAPYLAPNILCQIFEQGCSFKREVYLENNINCWLFDAGKNNQVLVVWNISEDTTFEKTPGTKVLIPFDPAKVKLQDSAGNEVKFSQNKSVMIGAIPVFFSPKNSAYVSYFENKCNNLKIKGNKLVGKKVNVLFKGIDNYNLNLMLNSLSKSFQGRYSVALNGKNISSNKIDIKYDSNKKIGIPLLKMKPDAKNHLKITFYDDKNLIVQRFERNISLILCHKLDKSSKLADKNLIKLPFSLRDVKGKHYKGYKDKKYLDIIKKKWAGDNDLSAKLSMGWNPDLLKIEAIVKDLESTEFLMVKNHSLCQLT